MKTLAADFNPSPETPPKAAVKSFFAAAAGGDLPHVRDCLDMYPVLIDWREETKATALIVAAKNGATGVVKALLEAGAELNAEDAGRMDALCWAAHNGHFQTADYLVGQGADPAAGRNGVSAIGYARAGDFPSLGDRLEALAAERIEQARARWRDTQPIENGLDQPVQVLKPFALKPPKL